MKVERVSIHKIKMPLKQPFITALNTVHERKLLITELTFQDGTVGWGECSAFDTPWYTEETLDTCLHVLSTYLIPALYEIGEFDHPKAIHALFNRYRGHHMAKSAIETALWDGYAKSLDRPLFQVLGGQSGEIEVGTAIGMQSDKEALLQRIQEAVDIGYKRIKLKVKPGEDLEVLETVRSHFPDVPLMVDANSSYTLADLNHLKKMDRYNLMMIEQPLGSRDFVEHAELQKVLDTPICLDESITSFEAAQTAIALKSAQILAVKLSRVGGLAKAVRIHDLCKRNGIEVWAGGMIESGVGKAHNMALATLDGFAYPGDIAASSKYWEKDIITPEIEVQDGNIILSERPGIGYEINMGALKAHTEETLEY
ncbi:o-succinylbenzoate synthase [Pseudalkalibacillus sp. Hm43]|uniref:o-succinylbenzoate synthase n=1 Tax=Pseudalkalibacillus sp. Hm43 TaxID=3450742 RepID=UPI003F43636D